MKTYAAFVAVLMVLVFAGGVDAAAPRFKAVAFDYFVLFDANSVLPAVEKEFPGHGQEFVKAWRSKQFEYGFLRSITHRHEDFFKVTDDALVYTANLLKLELKPEARARLLDAYLNLKLWPDSRDALRQLRAAGIRIITIANFSPKMLHDNAAHAGIENLFDELLSTETNATYKPEPAAYALGQDHLHLKKEDILFIAFGGWDAYGAKSFGYPTYWVNRFHLPVEQLGLEADRTSDTLAGVLEFVLATKSAIH